MDNLNWKDIAIRAGKTFLQAFIAVLIASKIGSIGDLVDPALLDQAAVAGLAALLSVAQNILTELGTK